MLLHCNVVEVLKILSTAMVLTFGQKTSVLCGDCLTRSHASGGCSVLGITGMLLFLGALLKERGAAAAQTWVQRTFTPEFIRTNQN